MLSSSTLIRMWLDMQLLSLKERSSNTSKLRFLRKLIQARILFSLPWMVMLFEKRHKSSRRHLKTWQRRRLMMTRIYRYMRVEASIILCCSNSKRTSGSRLHRWTNWRIKQLKTPKLLLIKVLYRKEARSCKNSRPNLTRLRRNSRPLKRHEKNCWSLRKLTRRPFSFQLKRKRRTSSLMLTQRKW